MIFEKPSIGKKRTVREKIVLPNHSIVVMWPDFSYQTSAAF